jgi:hypothetical protein
VAAQREPPATLRARRRLTFPFHCYSRASIYCGVIGQVFGEIHANTWTQSCLI